MLKIARRYNHTYKAFEERILDLYDDDRCINEMLILANKLIDKVEASRESRLCESTSRVFYKDRRLAFIQLLEDISDECVATNKSVKELEVIGRYYEVSVIEDNGVYFFSHVRGPNSVKTLRFVDVVNDLAWVHSNKIMRWRDETESWETDNSLRKLKMLMYAKM